MPDLLTPSLIATGAIAAAAWVFRSRAYAIFRLIALGLFSLLSSSVLKAGFVPEALVVPYLYLHGTVFVHSVTRFRPRMRPVWYRAVVSIPSAYITSATTFALPWVVSSWLGVELPGVAIAYLLALVGIYQSLFTRRTEVRLHLGDGPVEGLRRYFAGLVKSNATTSASRPLRVVQITDPHLGPFMSAQRLAGICRRAVEAQPDLILLTGDFLTMESQSDPDVFGRALEPLRGLPERVFACLGNHDYEALSTVKDALRSNGVRLLVDDSAVVQTPAGPVQIVGAAFHFRDRAERLRALVEAHPRLDGHLRLILLHDPGAFRHLPKGQGDLVFSGHTHGGQVGLQALGLSWTFVRLVGNTPDHGLWARDVDRLYVHRGTGHYGFPLRVGVAAEESVLSITSAVWPAAGGQSSLAPRAAE